jgi:excisionase family DNA binding protein
MTTVTPPTSGRRFGFVKEACAYGRFSRTTLYRLIGEGRIAAYKRDRTTIIDLDSVDAFYAALPPIQPRVTLNSERHEQAA